MLDIKYIRENKAHVEACAKNKNVEVDIDALLTLDEERRAYIQELDELRASKKNISKDFESKGGKDIKEKATELKTRIQEIEKKYKKVQETFDAMLYKIPNVTNPDMPVGKDEDENKTVREVGTKPQFDFEPKNHMELGESLDIIDVKKATEVSGARFFYLKNEAALLQFALVQFTFDVLTNEKTLKEIAEKNKLAVSHKAFVPMVPPVMIRDEVQRSIHRVFGDQTYTLEKDDHNLVASAEHTLAPYHMNEVIDHNKLPIRYIGYSTAFRKEAGTYGKDMGGILRTHQFDKLEMESFTDGESGKVEQDFIVAIQEYLVQQLNIPYRLVHVCTGDTGGPDYDQYDIECWLPGQKKYRETHTSDYMTDYQTRGVQSYYKTKDGKKELLHTNDATAFAIGRILIAILENNQTANGEVTIPEVLQRYVGKKVITKK